MLSLEVGTSFCRASDLAPCDRVIAIKGCWSDYEAHLRRGSAIPPGARRALPASPAWISESQSAGFLHCFCGVQGVF